jgi:NAD(P)-dependent dehydrogenase (short-subunit alcohol dehydrogenase family)
VSEGAQLPEGRASGWTPLRMLRPFLGQARRTRRCPLKPRLEGQVAVVTGATSGIGVEIARGLARRGADLVLPCRSPAKGQRVAEGIRSEAPARVSVVKLEHEDLASVGPALEAIEKALDGRRIELLVENAGVWPQRYTTTRQGHEIAFGVNVLAHFALRQALRARGLLREGRVVVVTGDIYVLARDCTPDFEWHGRLGGMRAYCRSKLGNLWIASELERRAPELEVYSVHPGVVATNLGGSLGGLGDRLRRRLLLSPELGAQTPLWCATQDGLERGGYYHNTAGLLRRTPRDPAHDPEAAARLWSTCEALVKS